MKREFAIGLVAGIVGLLLGMQTAKIATAQTRKSDRAQSGQPWKLVEDVSNADVSVSVFFDPNTTCWIYVTDSGRMAVTSAK
jgi:hypothetical protein